MSDNALLLGGAWHYSQKIVETGTALFRGIATIDLGIAAAQDGGNVYEVQRGDCLYDIAEKVYGDGRQWRRIYENNRKIIRRPEVIRPGMILELPEVS